MIKQIALYLVAFLLIVSAILFLFVSYKVLINFIVAFISSSLVVLASFKNYKTVVEQRLSTLDSASEVEDRDTIDKIEDPYNLYEQNSSQEDVDIKEFIKTQKEEQKRSRRSIKEVTKDSSSAFKPIRLVAYAILVGGFFYLLKTHNLVLSWYLPTLIVPNIIAVIYLLSYKK